MATFTIYATAANSGRITSTDNNYNNARSGSGTLSTATQPRAGQFKQTVSFTVYEAFIEFDTSVLSGATIVSATLEGYLQARYIDSSFTTQARLRDFGSAITTADWVAGASLSALTNLATLASGSTTVGAWNAFADVALAANLNTSGKTRILLCSSRTVSGTAPGTSTSEYLVFPTPDGTNSFRLIVETEENNGELSQSIGDFSLSATGEVSTHGLLSQSIGDFTLAAAGTVSGEGEGVLNQSIGDFTLSATGTVVTNGYLSSSIGDFTLAATTAAPAKGVLSASIGEFTLAAAAGPSIEGTLSASIGEFTLVATNSGGIDGVLSASIGEFLLVAVESGPPWPVLYDFPQKPLDGTWRRERGDDTLRSDRSVGARQYRAQNGGNYADATFAIMVKSKNALDLLDRFFRDDCKNGAKPFYWIDPETGDNMAWLWAAPPQIRHVARETYRVDCALLKEAA